MERFNMCYYRNWFLIIVAIVSSSNVLFGQGNCLVYPENSGERKACNLSYEAIEYRQGSKESQLLFDKAIEIGPKYAWVYYQKSVPFFKRGLFAEGVQLISKAIELEPYNYLHYRAYWYFYNRSYAHCAKDLEQLYSAHKMTYCTTPGGDLEMRLLLAMSHAYEGNVTRGIYWMKDLMKSYQEEPYLKGFYDHFCLGVLYYKSGDFDLAQAEFEKQIEIEAGFADTYYYLGLVQEEKSELIKAKDSFETALSRINKEQGGYTNSFFTEFSIQKSDIDKKLI